jgi:hypothetical protein
MTLANIWKQGKERAGRIPKDALWVGILGLSSCLFFGLGVLTEQDISAGEQHLAVAEIPVAAAILSPIIQNNVPTSTPPASAGLPADSYVVAAKTGTKYYYPWCGGAKRITAENVVTFASSTAAEAAGYTLATNCKKM